MNEKILILVGLCIVVVAAAVGCGGAPGGGDAASGDTALEITGSVDNAVAWTEEQVRSMDTIKAERENKEGELQQHTGVPIKALLEKAGVPDEASTVTFVGGDDYAADVDLADVTTCDDCIVAFRDEGGFRIVMPGHSGKVQVRDVVEIRVE